MKRRTVVKRSEWYRGQSSDMSALMRKEDGKMCCLGFDALSAGVGAYTILGMGEPREFGDNGPSDAQPWAKEWGSREGADGAAWILCDEAIDYNDNPLITDEEREKELARIFAENGIELVFED